MLHNIQQLSRPQRLLIFMLLFGGGLFLIIALAVLLYVFSLNSSPREQSVALVDTVTVKPFAVLPDNDAYPAAVAVAPKGLIYTGSYKTGALWTVDAAGSVTEVPGSREALGAVMGLTAAPDGTLFIVDQEDADPRTSGGDVKRRLPDGTIALFAEIPDERGFVAPNDVTLDAQGNVYVSDTGRDEVWRFAPDGSGGVVWWTPPDIEGVSQYEPNGLAYDAAHDAIIVTDGSNNMIYRVSVSDAATETIYRHGSRPDAPGFDGVTVTPGGAIYVAALAQNGIARVDGSELAYIAGLFRGCSDVDYSVAQNRLYVTNFDAFSLAVPAVQPRLPFALDEITFN